MTKIDTMLRRLLTFLFQLFCLSLYIVLLPFLFLMYEICDSITISKERISFFSPILFVLEMELVDLASTLEAQEKQMCISLSQTDAKRKFVDDDKVDDLKSSKRKCHEFIIPLEHIHEHWKLAPTSMRQIYMNCLMKAKKLTLVLDLDLTLIHTTCVDNLLPDEQYLHKCINTTKEKDEASLYRLDIGNAHMLVKLRPFLRQFLRETSCMYDIYVYTMGTREYAAEIVKILDPKNELFASKVISRSNCTEPGKKSLNDVLGSKTSTLIVDDTRAVWNEEDRKNLIEIKRYKFFASSSKGVRSVCRSLAEQRKDESPADGKLASILSLLKRAHRDFFDVDRDNPQELDIRRCIEKLVDRSS